jgi:phosphoribosyl 1,2-cyclic phosphate phosphodiesterase
MKITFLGTGTSSGVPVLTCQCSICQSLDYRDQRMRTSVHVEVDSQSVVIDSGPDFRMQMLKNRIQKLDAIIYTHEHKDHTAGLDDIRPFNYLNGNKPVSIYGHQRVLNQLKAEFHYAFAEEKYPGVPVIDLQTIDNQVFKIGETEILPINLLHHKLQVFGYRIGDFSYVTDANFITEEEKNKLKDSKVLVLNALQITKHISHFNLEEAIELALELNAERTYFTHISHKLGLHQEISSKLPPNIFLAYDGLNISV